MIPLFSKFVRTRSQMALATKTFVTSKSRWREKGEFSDKFKTCPPAGKRPREEPEKQGKGCGQREDEPKHSKKHDVNKKQRRQECHPSEFEEYLEQKKQGVSSACGAIDTTNEYLKETCKPRGLETEASPKDKISSRHIKSRSCSCPPYDTPKNDKETDCKKEDKTKPVCEEIPKEQNDCAPKQKKLNPCENKKPKCPSKENQCGTRQEDEACVKENNQKKSIYCGPKKTSYKDSCSDDKNLCGPIKTSSSFCPVEDENPCPKNPCPKKEIKIPELSPCCKVDAANECICKLKELERQWKEVIATQHRVRKDEFQKNDCPEVKEQKCCGEVKENPCPENPCPKKEIKIPELAPCCKVDSAKECICKLKELEREWKEVIATQERGGKDECQKNACPEVKEKKCCGEVKQNPCPENPCPKKEIKIPELAPCCKVDAANECLCKLKELERGWEEVIATQENGGKDDCLKTQESEKVGYRGSSMRNTSRSNLIYIVLGAILAAVIYYTYNEEFETEELFLRNEEMEEEDKDDDD